MAKRKRKAPLSYEDKYRQIKESKFDVDISRPTSRANKAMVTRYHRLLFGGRKSNGKYTRGIARNNKPIRTKYDTDIRNVFGVKGAPRIQSAYIPRQYGKVLSVSQSNITLSSSIGPIKFRNINPTDFDLMSRRERREELKGMKGKRFQFMLGQTLMPFTFDDVDDLLDAIDVAEDAYAKGDVSVAVHIVSL